MNLPTRNLVIGVVFALAAAAGGYAWWSQTRELPAPDTTTAGDRKVLYWYDPMVPDQHFDRPGKSPFMDMQLQPKYADEVAATGIAVSPVTQGSLGIRTVAVEKDRLHGEITVSGVIAWDLRLERVVSARTDVIVDQLYIKAPFTTVRHGQPLARVIAPAWGSALAEAQAIAQADTAGQRELATAAATRLRALGIPDGTRLDAGGRIVLTAPVPGVVSEIAVREGEAAPADAILFRINGTRTVWLQAALPQADAAGITAGTPAIAEVEGVPRRIEGRVEALLPQIDPSSRTQAARVVLDNEDGLLAAGQLARVGLQARARDAHWLVPTDAVIGSGERAHVIVRHGDAHFAPVTVHTGRSRGGRTEILHGLEGGEQVVASGQFLLDSEASLSGALERLGNHGSHR